MPEADSSTSPDLEEPRSPGKWDLSDEAVRDFQRILKKDCGVDMSFEAARIRAREVIDLCRLIIDPDGWSRDRETFVTAADLAHLAPGTPVTLTPPKPPKPDPRPYPTPLTGDHYQAVVRNLELARDEFKYIDRRPSNWRYAWWGCMTRSGMRLCWTLGRMPQLHPGNRSSEPALRRRGEEGTPTEIGQG